MAKKKMHHTSGYVLTDPRQDAKMTLADGFRFIMLTRGHSPWMIPITEPGTYEVGAEAINDGKYPIVVFTIDAAHVAMWESMTPERVDTIIADCLSPKAAQ